MLPLGSEFFFVGDALGRVHVLEAVEAVAS